ncbi:MAG: serine hydroxymethyltransferase, partial [Gammaproteobacteria bacterium]|nr:serine hydroxymethyltransferase [Gammaproteobacteria bacterium]
GPRGGLILAKSNPDLEKKLNFNVFPAGQGGPLEHVIAAKAVAFKEAMEPEFATYQKQVVVNAQAMAKVFIERGFDVVSGGTDDHLFLVSFIRQGLTGKDVEATLGRAFITVNKNAVPDDPQSPFVTSGIRIGTPAMTTRGFNEQHATDLAGWMCDIIDDLSNDATVAAVKEKVGALCAAHPVYA